MYDTCTSIFILCRQRRDLSLALYVGSVSRPTKEMPNPHDVAQDWPDFGRRSPSSTGYTQVPRAMLRDVERDRLLVPLVTIIGHEPTSNSVSETSGSKSAYSYRTRTVEHVL